MLEVNHKHKKANVSKYNSDTLQKFVAGGLIALSILSGSLNAYAKDIRIDVDYNIKQQLDIYLDKRDYYTNNDLSKLLRFSLMLEDDCDLSWLKYSTNLEELLLSYGDNVDSAKSISTIEGLYNLKKLMIFSYKEFDEFNSVNYAFLERCPNLKELNLNNMYIDNEFVESLKSLEVLQIGSNIINYNIDFNKLPNLKKVVFYGLKEYDLATYLDDYTLKQLEDRGIILQIDCVDLRNIIKINQKLNNIISNLNVTKYDSDEDKLNAILSYVLDNLSYDQEIYNDSKINKKNTNYINSFYRDGFLRGTLENDSAICGNYAALFQALANRLGMKSYFMINDYHAWNLVMIDNDYYYIDPTYLDGVIIDIDNDGKLDVVSNIIKSGNGNKLEWYMKDINQANDKNHQPINMPLHIEISSITENKYSYSSDDMYKIVLNNKESIVSLGVIVGIFSLLGLVVKNKKDKNERKSYK